MELHQRFTQGKIAMRTSLCITVLLSALVTLLVSCATKPDEKAMLAIPYPEPFPDSVPAAFLPGIVSTDSLDFNAAFSPDGRSFYFTRKIDGKTKIHVTQYSEGRWKESVPVPFGVTGHSDADPVFGPDNRLYFISDRPRTASDTLVDYDIWYVLPQSDGSWSAPENMTAVNSDSAEYYVSFSATGNLYFASARQGGYGAEDVYVSRRINDQYGVPENLGASINSERSEYDPCIAAGEDLIVFTSSNRDDGFGAGDLYGARTDASKKWQTAVNLGNRFNTQTREFCAYFTPDSQYFFFSSNRDVKWIRAEWLKKHL